MSRILVIDDQKVPRLAVAAILEEVGHEVVTAADGQEGIRLAAETSPDVIILDVYMPEMDGFAVVEELKSDPKTKPTPVIFLTAEPPTDDLIVRGLDLGAYDFVSKGCSRAELIARVGVMARIKRSTDELSAVARIADTLIHSLDPGKLSKRFVRQVQEIFRVRAVILSYATGVGFPSVLACAGLDDDQTPLIEALVQSLSTLSKDLPDYHGETPLHDVRGPAAVLVRRHGFESALVAHVGTGARPPALVAILTDRKEGFERQTDAQLLHLLARQVTIALDNALLHERTRMQAAAMEEQAEKLERAVSQRSRFFASMSHELRTPINAIIGYNELLELGVYGELSPEQSAAISRVGQSAHHLLVLINDILDISKIEAGKMEVNLEPTDLGMLVRETASTIHLQAAEKGLRVSLDVEPGFVIETDPARVRQILLNLLSNAVKFTKEGEISVQVAQFRDHCEIVVRDTGIGIDDADFDRIFEEFEQTTSAPGTGTGLGLPISRRLARLLGGDLFVESERGKGSTFTLRLPTTAPAPDTATAPDVTEPS